MFLSNISCNFKIEYDKFVTTSLVSDDGAIRLQLLEPFRQAKKILKNPRMYFINLDMNIKHSNI